MKLRVVGGPIKREDRVIIETTMHTTFDAILSAVHAEVERLDQIDLLAHELKRSDVGGFSPPAAFSGGGCDQEVGSSSNAQFGAEVDLVGDSDSDDNDHGSRPGAEVGTCSAAEHGTPARSGSHRGRPQRGSVGVPPTVCTTRLQQYPIDSVHYDVALFELDKDRKPSITRPCRPRDTPSSVKIQDPVIAIFLKASLQQPTVPNRGVAVEGAGAATSSPMATQAASQGSPSPSAAAATGSGSGLAAASPISPVVRRQPSTSGLLRATPSSFRNLGGADHPSKSSFRRSTSSLTDLTPILQSNATLHHCMILYKISRSDWSRTTAMERLLNRLGGKQRERFVEMANEALLPHAASSDGCGDALLGVSFHLQKLRQFLTTQLQQLDPRTSEESASMFAEMVVHASPMGDEKSFTALFLARYVQDTYMRFSQRSALASARRFWQSETSALTQWSVPCTALEVQQWEVLHRFALVRMLVAADWALALHGTLLKWLRSVDGDLRLETRRPCRGLTDLDRVVSPFDHALPAARCFDHLESVLRVFTKPGGLNVLALCLPSTSMVSAAAGDVLRHGSVTGVSRGGLTTHATIRRASTGSGQGVPLHAPVPKRSAPRGHAAPQHVDPLSESSPLAPAATKTESRDVSPVDALSTATRSPSNVATHGDSVPALSVRVAALEVEVSRMRTALEAQTKMLCDLLPRRNP